MFSRLLCLGLREAVWAQLISTLPPPSSIIHGHRKPMSTYKTSSFCQTLFICHLHWWLQHHSWSQEVNVNFQSLEDLSQTLYLLSPHLTNCHKIKLRNYFSNKFVISKEAFIEQLFTNYFQFISVYFIFFHQKFQK